jgi:hypothetical protein
MASYFYPQGRGSGRGGGRDAVSFYSPGLVVASARPRTCCVATPLVEHMTSLGRAAAALAYFRYGMAARGVRASLRALASARVYSGEPGTCWATRASPHTLAYGGSTWQLSPHDRACTHKARVGIHICIYIYISISIYIYRYTDMSLVALGLSPRLLGR